MGGRVLYASNSRLVMCTQRSDIVHAEAFVNSLRASLEQNPVFASLNIQAIKFWDVLLWVDANDYIGLNLSETEEDHELTVKLNTSKFIEERRYRELFEQILIGYLVLVARNVKTMGSVEEQKAYRSRLVNNEVSEQMFDILHSLPTETEPEDSLAAQKSVGLLVKAISHFIALDPAVSDSMRKLRYQLMCMMEADEATQEAEWQPLGLSYTLTQLFCSVCCQSSDLDVC
ncbi:unnamed protein product, partial [Gongylonema pulchrum]